MFYFYLCLLSKAITVVCQLRNFVILELTRPISNSCFKITRDILVSYIIFYDFNQVSFSVIQFYDWTWLRDLWVWQEQTLKKYITKTFGHRSVFGEDCSVCRTTVSYQFAIVVFRVKSWINIYIVSLCTLVYATDSEHSVRLRIDTRFNPEFVRLYLCGIFRKMLINWHSCNSLYKM